MTVPRATYRELLQGMLRDDVSAISNADCLDALQHAIARYSVFRPRVLVADLAVAADGVVTRDVSGLDEWDAETSAVRSVEYPIGEIPPVHIGHALYRAPAAVMLHAEDAPSGEMVRITYTAPHEIESTETSTPNADMEAVASWAAARLLDELAARSTGNTDSTISADGIERNNQASDYRRLAESYRNRFYELLGIDRKDEMRTPGASAVAQLASRRLSTGNRRLTHFRPGERYGT